MLQYYYGSAYTSDNDEKAYPLAELAKNAGRVQRVAEIDAAIGAWTAQHSVEEVGGYKLIEALGAIELLAGRKLYWCPSCQA